MKRILLSERLNCCYILVNFQTFKYDKKLKMEKFVFYGHLCMFTNIIINNQFNMKMLNFALICNIFNYPPMGGYIFYFFLYICILWSTQKKTYYFLNLFTAAVGIHF